MVRAVPFGPYPGRLGQPAPVILGEERHGRSFLLHQLIDPKGPRWRAIGFYHPLSSILGQAFDRRGVDGLYAVGSNPSGAAWTHEITWEAQQVFSHTFWVHPATALSSGILDAMPDAQERLDVSQGGAYAAYNWELFFHIPMLVAGRLARQQSFREAIAWYRRVFDPTVSTGSAPQRFWRFRRFHDDFQQEQPYQDLEDWLRELAEGSSGGEHADVVAAWRQDPLDPHRVARLRPGAYARSVVMRSIDTMVQWAETRFRAGDWAGINEATQLYLLAREMLGPRPRLMPVHRPQPFTYDQLTSASGSGGLDAFGNALVNTEGALTALDLLDDADVPDVPSLPPLTGASMLYFGIPANEQMLGLWDRIDLGLARIRAGLDIRGEARLSLPPGVVAPPAVNPLPEAGGALGMIASQAPVIDVAVPTYRFSYLLQKALEFAGEVRAFGAAVLAAYEKRDAEALARLRSDHEVILLCRVVQVRELQIEEAERALDAAKIGQQAAVLRRAYYKTRIQGSLATTLESLGQIQALIGLGLTTNSAILDLIAGILSLTPQLKVAAEFPLPPKGKGEGEWGGLNLGQGLGAAARAFSAAGSMAGTSSALLDRNAGYIRRSEEWDHQTELAENDIEQYERQIEAASLRVQIAKEEKAIQEMQCTHAGEIKEFLETKFTNQELYEWMIGELSELHHESYQLALDLARQVERCFRYERLPESFPSFVAPQSWNDLPEGLTAAERLQQDLRRMESAWLNHNSREYELTRHISLAEIDPVALIRLRQEGSCCFHLPEALFDADHPGHFSRRIKTVSLSMPCVTGPYTGINARLALGRSEVRISPEPGTLGYPRQPTDDRFKDILPGSGDFALSSEMTAIVTSGGQADSGLFETNLRDERYLPFEGAGVVSTWRLDVPQETNRFDPATITDVVLHLRYTARKGQPELRDAAWQDVFGSTYGSSVPPRGPCEDTAANAMPPLRLLSVRHQFPDAWHRLFAAVPGQGEALLDLKLAPEHFPFQPEGLKLRITKLRFLWIPTQGETAVGLVARLSHLPDSGGPEQPVTAEYPAFVSAQSGLDLPDLAINSYTPPVGADLSRWNLRMSAADNTSTSATVVQVDQTAGTLQPMQNRVADLLLLIEYEVTTGP